MIICGIDPGTQCTGFGLIDISGHHISYVAHGTIRPKNHELADRLKEIHLSVSRILDDYVPLEMAVETSFYATNAQTALKLGQVRGVIILAATLIDIPVFEYSPTEVKKATCGFGHADKIQIGSMVHSLLRIPKGCVDSKDATDALAIALCHAASRRMRSLQAL